MASTFLILFFVLSRKWEYFDIPPYLNRISNALWRLQHSRTLKNTSHLADPSAAKVGWARIGPFNRTDPNERQKQGSVMARTMWSSVQHCHLETIGNRGNFLVSHKEVMKYKNYEMLWSHDNRYQLEWSKPLCKSDQECCCGSRKVYMWFASCLTVTLEWHCQGAEYWPKSGLFHPSPRHRARGFHKEVSNNQLERARTLTNPAWRGLAQVALPW